MKIKELCPPPAAKVLFRLSAAHLIPLKPGCYVLSTSDDAVLYIGLASSLGSRFGQHLDNREKTNSTKMGRAFYFYYLECETRNLERLERSWLNQYCVAHGQRPLLNKADSPVS